MDDEQDYEQEYEDLISKPIRVIVCGDRNWKDEGTIAMFLSTLAEGSTVIHGCCRGADEIAGNIAKEFGFEVEEYPADWDTYGFAAGPIRNRQMLHEGKPDLVAAFHEHFERSKGTKDMVTVADDAGILTVLFDSEE